MLRDVLRRLSCASARSASARHDFAPRAGGPRHSSSAQQRVHLHYYSAWFCPFAHRCTIALEHHADVVGYEWEEALGWERRAPTGGENFAADAREDWWYHWKSPGLLASNPHGMVPTLVEPLSGRAVTESVVAVQFVDELARASGGGAPPLVPADPFEAARARVAAEKVNRQVTSNYYQVLVREDDGERRRAFCGILDGLRAFAADAAPRAGAHAGAFWGGRDVLSLVDCVLLPYAWRLYVLEHYRGPAYAVPTSGDGGTWAWYAAWLERATALEPVARTLPDKGRYLEHVAKYAHNQARSKVGNAVRRGVAAHDYDDEIDGDANAQK